MDRTGRETIPPRTDAEYKACDYGVKDSCDATGAPCGNATTYPGSGYFAGMSGVTIPPGGKVLVYTTGWDKAATGKFKLNVRTDSMQ